MQKIQRSIEPELFYDESRLLVMLGEELKKPLTAIKALAEQSEHTSIQLEARKALRSVDNLLYFQQVSSRQTRLAFTTVHVGNTLAGVAHEMRPLSLEKGCETELAIQPGLAPVHADPHALRFGLESLWQAMIGMTSKPSPLNWHVYRSPKGIRIVLVNPSINTEHVRFSQAASAAGKAKQPFKGIAGPATDLLTAQNIFTLLGTKLTKVTKDGQHGFSLTLPVSTQLALV